jgi:hypothetical protein
LDGRQAGCRELCSGIFGNILGKSAGFEEISGSVCTPESFFGTKPCDVLELGIKSYSSAGVKQTGIYISRLSSVLLCALCGESS